MALSKSTKAFLESMVTSQPYADEIERRLLLTAPATAAAAVTALLNLNQGREFNSRLADCLRWALADDGSEGAELARVLNGCVEVVHTKAYSYVAAVKASKAVQDLTYVAKNTGTGGNAVTVSYVAGAAQGAEVVTVVVNAIEVQIADGASTATQVKTAVDNSVAAMALLTSCTVTGVAGDAQDAFAPPVNLAGGAVAKNPDMVAAKILMGSTAMSARTLTVLASAICSAPAAAEIKAAYDAMVTAIQATTI